MQACEGVLNALQSNPAERLIYVGEKSLPALALVRVSKVAASYSENAQRAATLLICACAMLQPLGGLDGITLTPLHPVVRRPVCVRPPVFFPPLKLGALDASLCLALARAPLTPAAPLPSQLMKHCIESKLFAEGAAFAQRDVFAVDPDVTPVTSDVAPRYFYLAGVIFIALEKWSNASEMLERCITLPATAVSAVAVAAYKKLVLVSLIEKGAAPTLPVHTADIVARALYPEPLLEDVQAYAAIASAYAARNFEAIVAMHDPVLRSDGNVQLMVRCVSSVPAFKVKRLTRAYVTLPLAVVAEKVGLATARDAERLILQLAFEGALVAQIDAVSGDVAFEEAEGASGSSSDASKLEGGIGIAALHAQLQRTMELAQQLQKVRARGERGREGAGVGLITHTHCALSSLSHTAPPPLIKHNRSTRKSRQAMRTCVQRQWGGSAHSEAMAAARGLN